MAKSRRAWRRSIPPCEGLSYFQWLIISEATSGLRRDYGYSAASRMFDPVARKRP
jgi:hypothetical protein